MVYKRKQIGQYFRDLGQSSKMFMNYNHSSSDAQKGGGWQFTGYWTMWKTQPNNFFHYC